MLTGEIGLTPVEASTIYSIYNGVGILGKLLVGVVISTPSARRRGALVYLLFPLLMLLSHFILLEVDVHRLCGGVPGVDELATADWEAASGGHGGVGRGGGIVFGGDSIFDAVRLSRSVPRLYLFALVSGMSYGYCASGIQLLPREFFGLVDLTKLQPLIFGRIEVGEIFGMWLPGVMRDTYHTYCASLLISLFSMAVCFSCFVLMWWAHPLELPAAERRPPGGRRGYRLL